MRSFKLYRIISLESFIELLDLKEEVYTSPSIWKDSYEGCALQFIDNEKNRKRFIDALVSQYCENKDFINAVVDNYVKAEIARYCCFAQCWSHKKESDSLWNKFGIGSHAIQIESDTGRIAEILNSQELNPRICKIEYDIKEKDEPESFIRFYQKGTDFKDQFFHKRKAFKEEGEYRVLITRDDYATQLLNRLNIYRQGLVGLIEAGKTITVDSIIETINEVKKQHIIQLEPTLKVQISDVSKYIRGVRVHPDAEQWYVDFVKELCLKHKVGFKEKSSLYKESKKMLVNA